MAKSPDKRLQKDGPSRDQPADTQPGQPAKKTEPSAVAPDPADELKEQLLRVRADFENYKRRAEEQQTKLSQVARTDVILDLLPVLDNFDRAAASVPKEIEQSNWFDGVKAIKQQFQGILSGLNIERIECVGKEFDPNFHEALSHEPSQEHQKGIITKEFEAGYRLGEDVIRHARVAVSSGKPDENSDKEKE